MSKVILYRNQEGGVSIITPTEEAIYILGIDAIAKKDVPSGEPYKVVEVNADNFPVDGTVNENGIPNIDKTFRDAWTVDAEYLTDGFGADYGVGSVFDVVGYKNDEVVIVRDQETGDVFEKPIG